MCGNSHKIVELGQSGKRKKGKTKIKLEKAKPIPGKSAGYKNKCSRSDKMSSGRQKLKQKKDFCISLTLDKETKIKPK